MFYPQGNFHSQANLGYPQASLGYPQGGFGYSQGGPGQQSFQAAPNPIPFANTLYGYPQLTPYFPQGIAQNPPQVSNWQHPAQQQSALQQAVLQQALLQLLAPQLPAQSPAFQHPAGISGLNGMANGAIANGAGGAGQFVGAWQQPQPNPEQINPAVLQQPQHQLQRLAQYHYLVAQQFAQLAAQHAIQTSGNPYPGQFIPSQLGANFAPGITMH